METVAKLESKVGGLSMPSKMPGLAYGIPASACKVGSLLRKRPGSVCSACYAHKGTYRFPVVKAAQAKRLDILLGNLEEWREDMVRLLSRKYAKKSGPDAVFRWHDSGDIQSLKHLEAIASIANSLPGIRFWIPTKEYAIVKEFIAKHKVPTNLVIRVSAPNIGIAPVPLPGTVSSTVGAEHGYHCPAYTQGGECGDCRACWDPKVPSVNYPLH